MARGTVINEGLRSRISYPRKAGRPPTHHHRGLFIYGDFTQLLFTKQTALIYIEGSCWGYAYISPKETMRRLFLGNVFLALLSAMVGLAQCALAESVEVLFTRPAGAPLFGFAINQELGAEPGEVVNIPICRALLNDFQDIAAIARTNAEFQALRQFSRQAVQRIDVLDLEAWCNGRERMLSSPTACHGSNVQCLTATPICYCLGDSRRDGNCTPAPSCNATKRCSTAYGNGGISILGYCYRHSDAAAQVADLN